MVAFDEGAALVPTTRLVLSDMESIAPLDAVRPVHAREQHLQALLAISTAIHAIRDERELGGELLDQLFTALPAAEGAVLRSGSGTAFDIEAVRPESKPGVVHVHADTVRRAISEGAGILCAASDRAATAAGQTVTSRAASVLVGSIVGTGTNAWRCLPDVRPGSRFTDDHLQLATAVARISAIAIDNIRQRAALERETDRLQADLHFVNRMIGDSPPLRHVESLITRVARVDTTVLITGETGTGKELAARAIHLRSAGHADPLSPSIARL